MSNTERQERILEFQNQFSAVVDNISKVIKGKREVIEHVLTALTAGGHVMLLDVPGTGKTMLARSIAASIQSKFKRIQFTPDLLPMDITGNNIFNMRSKSFVFQPGPIFTNLLLADEINRATPKTQSALLEVMAERQGDSRRENPYDSQSIFGHCNHEPTGCTTRNLSASCSAVGSIFYATEYGFSLLLKQRWICLMCILHVVL